MSPFLNRLIENMPKKMHLNLLIILFIFFCIWQFIEKIEVIGVSGGFGLNYFIFLYFFGGYINKYKFVIKDLRARTYLMLYIIFAIFNTVVYIYGTNHSTEFLLFKRISRLYSYNSPLVLIIAYCIFQYFHNIKVKSSLINYIAKYVFGIYLIHENQYVREILWRNLGIIEDVISSNQYLFLLKILKFSTLIFLSCWILSLIISKLYYALYELLKSIYTRKMN
nr:acyltransferase family protein [Desemzia sp. RIT 804]